MRSYAGIGTYLREAPTYERGKDSLDLIAALEQAAYHVGEIQEGGAGPEFVNINLIAQPSTFTSLLRTCQHGKIQLSEGVEYHVGEPEEGHA